jgi:hypothetical protein
VLPCSSSRRQIFSRPGDLRRWPREPTGESILVFLTSRSSPPVSTGCDKWYQRRCILGVGGGRPQLLSALVIGSRRQLLARRRWIQWSGVATSSIRRNPPSAPGGAAAALDSDSDSVLFCGGYSFRRRCILWWRVAAVDHSSGNPTWRRSRSVVAYSRTSVCLCYSSWRY